MASLGRSAFTKADGAILGLNVMGIPLPADRRKRNFRKLWREHLWNMLKLARCFFVRAIGTSWTSLFEGHPLQPLPPASRDVETGRWNDWTMAVNQPKWVNFLNMVYLGKQQNLNCCRAVGSDSLHRSLRQNSTFANGCMGKEHTASGWNNTSAFCLPTQKNLDINPTSNFRKTASCLPVAYLAAWHWSILAGPQRCIP